MAPLRTLPQALEEAAASTSGYCFANGETETWRRYADLRGQALQLARSLRDGGFGRGELVALVLPDAEPFLIALFGVSLSGAVPASMPPPSATAGLPQYFERTAAILRHAGARAVVTARRFAAPLAAAIAAARPLFARPPAVLVVDDLDAPAAEPDRIPALDDVALVQFTSGSTSSPKGVVLTHANLAANIEAFGGPAGIAIARDDIGVSWLPLSHDMGLVGMALGALYAGRPCVLLPTQEFVKRPAQWLRAITRHRATVSFAPNFAYDLCVRRVGDSAGLDLSSWRVAGCGAEPVHAATLAAFAKKFSAVGFRETSYAPCYGLAEHVLAATVSPPGRCLRIEQVSVDALGVGIANAPRHGERAVAFVSCGRPLPGHQLRIVENDDRVVGERQVGEIQLAGPSVMTAYHNEAALTGETVRDGWLRTGDLGYVSGGELFVCGRVKDLVIVNGRKFHSEDLECAVERVAGVRQGRAVAFAAAADGAERVVIVVEADGSAGGDAVVDSIRREIAGQFGLVVDDVVVVPSGSVARTTSGKVQRAAMRDRYELGIKGINGIKD